MLLAVGGRPLKFYDLLWLFLILQTEREKERLLFSFLYELLIVLFNYMNSLVNQFMEKEGWISDSS